MNILFLDTITTKERLNHERRRIYREAPPGKDCTKKDGGWGNAMNDYEYIWYGNIDEDKYPDDACKPYYHKVRTD